VTCLPGEEGHQLVVLPVVGQGVYEPSGIGLGTAEAVLGKDVEHGVQVFLWGPGPAGPAY
jgi:hypothetical protein